MKPYKKFVFNGCHMSRPANPETRCVQHIQATPPGHNLVHEQIATFLYADISLSCMVR